MARRVNRGEISMYRFAAPDKRRPVLVVSRDEALAVMPLGTAEGLKGPCVANLDHVFTIRQADLRRYVSTVGAHGLTSVCRALGIATGCL